MFSQASKGLRCKALENAVRLLYHKAVRKAQRLPWSETALTVSEWFNVLSGVQRLALQGFGERREVIIPHSAARRKGAAPFFRYFLSGATRIACRPCSRQRAKNTARP